MHVLDLWNTCQKRSNQMWIDAAVCCGFTKVKASDESTKLVTNHRASKRYIDKERG